MQKKNTPQKNSHWGKFIVFEGIDGCGKTSILESLSTYFNTTLHIKHRITREPGGCDISNAIRALLLEKPMHEETETLLMFAARRQHLEDVIIPTLKEGEHVLCDRFTPSTYAYQGGGKGLDKEKIGVLEQWITSEATPDKVFLFNISVETALKRRKAQLKQGNTKDAFGDSEKNDRFEREDIAFKKRVHEAYKQLAMDNPELFVIIDAEQSIDNVKDQVLKELAKIIPLGDAQ